MEPIREVALVFTGREAEGEAKTVRHPDCVARIVRDLYGDETQERVIALHLDARHCVTAARTVSLGTATAALIHPREVYRGALIDGAASIVLAHNHPSGDPSPSAEDRSITDRLLEAGALLGVPLVDHVIVAHHGFYSFREAGEIA